MVANIAGHLALQARERPLTLAIVEPRGVERPGPLHYRHLTYQELEEETAVLACGLEALGIGRGVRTVLMVPPSLEFYTLTFALFKVGAVVVLIDPGMGVKNLGVCLGEAEPEAFIGVPKAHLARVLLGWARRSVRTCISVGARLGWGGHSLAALRQRGQEIGRPRLAQAMADDQAAILFTSGSTGVAKGVVYTHGIFAAQLDMLRGVYGIEPGEIDLPTFPLFGLFGPALGMTAIIPEMDATRPAQVDPVKISAAVQRFGVTNLFGSPALVRRVGAHGAACGIRLPSLRRVISAGAPVPAAALEAFAKMLSAPAQIHTPYGATEALPVSTIGSSEILSETRQRTAEGGGVCVGRPVPGMSVRVIGISDEPIVAWHDALEVPATQIGEVVVRGPVVTRRYYNRPQSTALAKIEDPERGGFWHRMGDVGYLDDQGRLWFCGRKSQRVVAGGQTYFTLPCEGVFNAHRAVFRTALVGVRRGEDIEPALCVERAAEAAPMDDDRLRAELLALGAAHAHTKTIRTILFHPSFPVDIRHNAKIFREKLAVWAAAQLRSQA